MSAIHPNAPHDNANLPSSPAGAGTKIFEQVLADPSTSFWLRDAVRAMLARDPVDALADAEALASLMKMRLDASLPPPR